MAIISTPLIATELPLLSPDLRSTIPFLLIDNLSRTPSLPEPVFNVSLVPFDPPANVSSADNSNTAQSGVPEFVLY